MPTFQQLRDANTRRNHAYDPNNKLSASYHSNELGGECGEAQNLVKKLERQALGFHGSRATLEQLADELADVVICADKLAMRFGIHLEEAIVRKFNKTSYNLNLLVKLPDDS